MLTHGHLTIVIIYDLIQKRIKLTLPIEDSNELSHPMQGLVIFTTFFRIVKIVISAARKVRIDVGIHQFHRSKVGQS